jgi:DNA-binding NarL/FixJ family response regulator
VAARGLGDIDASSTSRFRLAAMRCGDPSATLDSMTVRCLIVDDNHFFLEAGRTLLEREGLVVVGLASTSAEALRKAEALRPDVVLVDVWLGLESGFELARRLVADDALGARVILISTSSEADLADLVALIPTAGFLSKAELSADAIRGFLDRS